MSSQVVTARSSDKDIDEFVLNLRTQVEIFVNRMKSNSSRGRPIANDSSVQNLFQNAIATHSKLLNFIQEQEDLRIRFEELQDKLTQVKDARAALDALREEEKERRRFEAEQAERIRQAQMREKLELMRMKKQEYLQYQRQVALHRMQEQEREMQFRHEQAKQQYAAHQVFPTYPGPVTVMQNYHHQPYLPPPVQFSSSQMTPPTLNIQKGPEMAMQQPPMITNPYQMQNLSAALPTYQQAPQTQGPQQPGQELIFFD